MSYCKLPTICIAEISKPASRIAMRIFPSSPENTEQMDAKIQNCQGIFIS